LLAFKVIYCLGIWVSAPTTE